MALWPLVQGEEAGTHESPIKKNIMQQPYIPMAIDTVVPTNRLMVLIK
jgi:hypothetical protein